jgi:hypothetical protein
MKRSVLMLALIFTAAFAATFVVTSTVSPPTTHQDASASRTNLHTDGPVLTQPSRATYGDQAQITVSIAVATFGSLMAGIGWTVWRAIRAGPWTPRTRRAQEATVAATASPWWFGRSVDCAGGSSGDGGCADF